MDKIHLEAMSRHTWRTRLWSGTEIRELPRTNNIWPICLSFMMRFLAALWRGEKWMLYTLTWTGSLVWSCIESLQPNWGGMDWINGLQGEKKNWVVLLILWCDSTQRSWYDKRFWFLKKLGGGLAELLYNEHDFNYILKFNKSQLTNK